MSVSIALGKFGSISPWLEMGAYETLWSQANATFKSIAEMFRARPNALPSEMILPGIAENVARDAAEILRKAGVNKFGVRILGAAEYPKQLLDANAPLRFLYFQGWWDLVHTRSVAVVGTREPSMEGKARAAKLVKQLVQDKFTIVSGLAKGIDTIAHETAIESGGLTMAVIGTPLSHSYPNQNKELQRRIAEEYLLISQVPIIRYSQQHPKQNRWFFPERNVTMSALTEATVIIEAGETSGTLVQARAAISQGRKLFILDNCFRNTSVTWPARFEQQGAIRVRSYEDIREHLSTAV
jgi:DNA processing protein